MSPVLKPWQLWVVALAGWINEQPASSLFLSVSMQEKKAAEHS